MKPNSAAFSRLPNGAIYAIRRDKFVPIPNNTIVDDFVIPLLAKLHHGGTIIYDASATATEESAADVKAEFKRRARIGAGGFQAITLLWRLLNPKYGWLAFTFFSHKVLRWLCPFFLIGMLVANLALVQFKLFQYLLAAQIAFSTSSRWSSRSPPPPAANCSSPFALAPMFTSMNLALLVGFSFSAGSPAARMPPGPAPHESPPVTRASRPVTRASPPPLVVRWLFNERPAPRK